VKAALELIAGETGKSGDVSQSQLIFGNNLIPNSLTASRIFLHHTKMPPKGQKRKSVAATSPKSKKQKPSPSADIPEKYIRQQAEEFLQSLHISTSPPPSSKDVLQLLVACLILSARMTESISTKTFVILKNEYDDCDFETLTKASWDDLCGVCNGCRKIY